MHFLKDIHTLKHAYSPTGDLEQSCLVFFQSSHFLFSLFHPDQFDSLFLFLLTHFNVWTHWRDVPMGGEVSRRNASAPLLFLFLLVAQQKRNCKHSCLSNRCLHAQAHARLHSGQKQANNEPSFSDIEPIRSEIDRRPRGEWFCVAVAIFSHLQRHKNTF